MEGEKILAICERGDRLLDEEVGKVYKGKKISKGLLIRACKRRMSRIDVRQELHILRLSHQILLSHRILHWHPIRRMLRSCSSLEKL